VGPEASKEMLRSPRKLRYKRGYYLRLLSAIKLTVFDICSPVEPLSFGCAIREEEKGARAHDATNAITLVELTTLSSVSFD